MANFVQPYRAQGAAMAVEDAAVLGSVFSHLSSKAQIPTLLKAYENLRYASPHILTYCDFR